MTRIAEWIARRAGATRCALVAVALGLMVTAALPIPPSLAWCALAAAAVGLGVGMAGRRRGLALCGSARRRALRRPARGRPACVRTDAQHAQPFRRPAVHRGRRGGQFDGRHGVGARCCLLVERASFGSGPSVGIAPESVRLEVSGADAAATDAGAAISAESAVPRGEGSAALMEGSRVRVVGRLVAPSDGADGGFDQRAALRREGCGGHSAGLGRRRRVGR